MKKSSNQFREIWCVHFTEQTAVGEKANPIVMCALELFSGRRLRLEPHELVSIPQAPYCTSRDVLFVGYDCVRDLTCHISLGWSQPKNVIDLLAEFRNATNGAIELKTRGIGEAMAVCGLAGQYHAHNTNGINRRQNPYAPHSAPNLTEAGSQQTDSIAHLFSFMRNQLDLPRALLRGRYLCALSEIEQRGIPLDAEKLQTLISSWDHIAEIPDNSIAKANPAKLCVGTDDRNRCALNPFRAKTSRNQPSGNQFIFGQPSWLRGLIRPRPGYGLAYIDWCHQEFGIGAALSRDDLMCRDYLSGDPYLAFAKQAGAVPPNASSLTHASERDIFKKCALAVQYGAGPRGLARWIDKPFHVAEELLHHYRSRYYAYWDWSNGVVEHVALYGQLQTVFGWTMFVNHDTTTGSVRNFPLQANAAEMMRVATIGLIDAGIEVCAPVHDAFLIEAPLGNLDDVVRETQRIMAEASAEVLDGLALRSEADVFRFPDRFTNPHGKNTWDAVNRLLAGL